MTTAHIDTLPWHRQAWPWLLMAGPAAVVVAGTFTAYLAYTREDALVVGDYYKQGKAINQSLHRDRVAAQMGLGLDIAYDAAAGQLHGHLAAKNQLPKGEVVLRLVHPTLPGKDMAFVVRPDAQGNFSVKLPLLELGRWQVVAEDPQAWRLGGVWNWPKEHSVRVAADPTLAEIE